MQQVRPCFHTQSYIVGVLLVFFFPLSPKQAGKFKLDVQEKLKSLFKETYSVYIYICMVKCQSNLFTCKCTNIQITMGLLQKIFAFYIIYTLETYVLCLRIPAMEVFLEVFIVLNQAFQEMYFPFILLIFICTVM